MSPLKRRLAGSVLIFEAIVIVLAVPVAVNIAHVPAAAGWMVGLGFAAACLLVAGRVDRAWGTTAGWLVQAGVVASAVVVPMMAVLGVMFAGLWFAALHLAAKAEAAPSEATAETSPADAMVVAHNDAAKAPEQAGEGQ